jgi:exonuclease-1
MGIENLLITMKEYMIKKKLRDYKGKTLGIDGHVWLHTSLWGNKMGMAFNENPNSYLIWLEKKIKRLIELKINMYFVFDGEKNIYKGDKLNKRKICRENNFKKALEIKNIDLIKAKKLWISSIGVENNMVYKFTLILDKYNIPYIIAPYEGDAQLAYLLKKDLIDAILTIDSDLIAYNCKKIIFKLDFKSETCYELNIDDIYKSDKFKDWDYETLLEYCILCGCDYFKIKGVGSNIAYNLMKKYKRFYKINEKFMNKVNFINFYKAKSVFLKQMIYCPILNKRMPLDENNNESVGENYSDLMNELISKCYINPLTKLPY